MSRRSAGHLDRLTDRLDTLREVVAAGPERVPAGLLERAGATVEQADRRLRHGSAYTVVAIAGATGSGKSTLFNALVGSDVATVGVRRPTTSVAQAAVFGGGAEELLDWLEVPRRHAVPASELDGLVLLDLPDHDSVEAAHRREVDRLVEVVDTFLWVVDPQKYADAALHQQYLSRFAAHGAVTIVALNKVDTVTDPADRRAMIDDVGRLVAADGLRGVRVIPASARDGDGLEALRRELAARVSERQALVDRLTADIDWLVDDLRAAVGDADPQALDRDGERRLVDALAFAAGVDALADTVGAAHRHRSVQQVGWPPVRWVRRLRPDPLRRLGLDREQAARVPGTEELVARSSRPKASAVAHAAVDDALRTVATRSSAGLPDLWVERVHATTASNRDALPDALDVAIASADLPTRTPRWWAVASLLQWTATAAMTVGLLWLVLIGVVAWFGLPDLPTPGLGAVPLPTALALGGAAMGLLIAAIARWAAAVSGRRRARTARKELRRHVDEVAQRLVVDPLDHELAELRRLRALTHQLEPGS